MKYGLLILMMLPLMAMAKGKIEADITLFPAGDFEAKSNQLEGYLVEKDGALVMGKEIKVKVDSFKTGIDLRDKHMKEYMGMKKHPYIEIKKGIAKGGKGAAIMAFNGVEKKISFTYEKKKKEVEVKFNFKPSDFGIKDISYQGIGVEDKVEIEAEVPLK